MGLINLVYLVPLLPLLGWALIGLLGKKLSKGSISLIGCGSVLGAFALSAGIFLEVLNGTNKSTVVHLFSWIHAGTFSADFSFLVDPLSCLFLLIITGVGFLIHVYSVGYMHDDERFHTFFTYMNLFVFFMLLLVLGSNYLLMFVGWEGVGLCSYLLIGFWFKNTEYNKAANKAFIMNRVGDLGFVLGIILIFLTFGSISYGDVFGMAKGFSSGQPVMIAITLLLFIGAMGKSAQIPLYTWLPDAMAGPTPVSALIHAATMVTAGIYMIARSNILYTLAPVSMDVVAGTGLLTAIFAATIGLAQTDIKKVLAYSTVSQLGYMFLALGVGAFGSGVFHVTTHAFFKALLFLAAGSVIHALHHEQDIRRMGGLKNYLPVTHTVFLVGTLAIAGIPPFSGFFSKDEILAHAYERSPILWLFAMLGALITSFYMFRLYYLTFHGDFRGGKDKEHHIHESPRSMTVPLMALAFLSVVGGLIGIPEALGGKHALSSFLAPVFEDSELKASLHVPLSHETEYALMGGAVVAILLVIYVARQVYVQKKALPPAEGASLSPAHKVVLHKYYVDEFYNAIITRPLNKISELFYKFIELKFIDGIVNWFGKATDRSAGVLRYVQTGSVGFYIFAMVISIALILFWRMM